MGGSSSSTQRSYQSPWAGQAGYLMTGFGAAQDRLGASEGTPFWSGDLYTPMNDTQKQGVAQLTNNANNMAGYAPGMMQTGYGLFQNALPGYQQVASNFATGNFNQGSNTAAQQAIGNVQNGITSANTALNGAITSANSDPTQSNITNAGLYANNPYLNAQIDAANRDVQRDLYENQLPTINAQASAGGNLNSSRAGAAEAIATRGAADQMADTAANMRSQAYQQGLNLAEGARTADMNANLTAAGVGNAMTSLGLTGENNANANNIANQQLALSGNAQQLAGANAGLNLFNTGANAGAQAGNQLLQAGGVQQADQNADSAADYQLWQAKQQYPWQNLQNFWNVVGGNQWGSEGLQTSKQSTPFNPLQAIGTIGGLALAPFSGGMSLAGMGINGLFGAGTVMPNYGFGMYPSTPYFGSAGVAPGFGANPYSFMMGG